MKKNLSLLALSPFLLWGCASLMNTESSQKQAETPITPPPSASMETPSISPSSPSDTQSESSREATTAPTRKLTRVQIRLVQQRLKAAGFDPGAIDGVLGAKTRAALRKYQGSQGLPNHGTIDEKTLKSLGVE
jgi:His-Xaa-Ser repeat protein HxsA